MNDLAVVAKFAQVALKVITTRALTWAAMFFTAFLFAWVLYEPHYIRLSAATIFGLLVFWRVTWVEKITEHKPQGEAHE